MQNPVKDNNNKWAKDLNRLFTVHRTKTRYYSFKYWGDEGNSCLIFPSPQFPNLPRQESLQKKASSSTVVFVSNRC